MHAFLIALSIAFWIWCGGLAVVAALLLVGARGLSAEAGGAGFVLGGAFAALMLAASLLVRALLWWLL